MRGILSSFIVLLAIFLPIVLVPRLVKVKQFDCKSQFGPCSPSLTEALNTIQPSNIVRSKKNIANAVSGHVDVQAMSSKFVLPDKMEVYVVERKPYGAIRKVDDKNYYLIDQDGIIVSVEEGTALPTVLVQDDLAQKEIGVRVDETLVYAAELVRFLYKMYRVNEVVVNSDSITTEMEDGVKVYFPTEGEVKVLMGALAVIQTQYEATPYQEIDLRFEDPVLR